MKTYLANRKMYFLVGMSLAGMIFILARTGQAEKDAQYATAFSGKMAGKNSSSVQAKMETLAKSDHIALLEFCMDHYRDTYHDYTCLLQKQERMGGVLGQVQEVEVKFMGEPFSVSMHWIKNHPSIADRALYVEGKWNDQMIVRPSGLLAFLGPQFRPPGGADAVKSSLKPITAFGIERTTRSLIDVYTLARKNGDLRQEFGGYAKVDGRNTLVLVRYLPCKPQYPGWKTLTYIDLEYLEPIMLETYGWDDQHLLLCRYVFRDTKFNVGLTKEDFLPEANEMVEPR